MPSAIDSEPRVAQVSSVATLLNEALAHARLVKPSTSIEPALTESNFEGLLAALPQIFADSDSVASSSDKARQFAIVETAARNLFSSLVANTQIDAPEFVQVWNFFDILCVLSDNEQCDPALLCWLVEELLDAQTIDGCRRIFDYLESRRERIIAKNLKQKHLVILRTCNELLRRLSRAEDAAFCGRVFIFMFQSFSLGDRSSVNLRGEYHVDNVTAYEAIPEKNGLANDEMEVDEPSSDNQTEKEDRESVKPGPKAVSFDAKNKPASEKPLDTDGLYPVFWSLQHHFSQPLTLFDTAEFAKFQAALGTTLTAFETVDKMQRSTKSSDETRTMAQKRKHPESAEERDGSTYNPKYLTSRDLFDLEIGDLYFRRHILIQALIVMEFLASLTPQAKAKISGIKAPNKSVVYADHTLGEEDAKWVRAMKERITSYLQAGPDGYFFFRVVESVLSRDKGWVRWKIESCPPIERPAVTPTEFREAMDGARRLATNKRLRPTPMGALDLNFLQEEDGEAALERLKDAARWKLPDLDKFRDKIASDDLDLSFASSEKEKADVLELKASKTWRAFRLARREKLANLDHVEEWQKVDAIFEDLQSLEGRDANEDEEKDPLPEDSQPVIIVVPQGLDSAALTSHLMELKRGVFERVVQHTTRSALEGEVHGKDFHFVDMKAFNQILDGDYFLETISRDGHEYGTNRKLADALMEASKVPIIELDRERASNAKDMGYRARYVFVAPSNVEDLESLIKTGGIDDDTRIQGLVKAAQTDVEHSKTEGFYDMVISHASTEDAAKELEAFIYGTTVEASDGANGVDEIGAVPNGTEEDATMGESEAAPVADETPHDSGEAQEPPASQA
ncbi:THO complex subunit 1 transcription elongation factor-domain-containing protein [Microdochium trichocladiopsis]|uniref:THO complex subunit 1 transcription elongation factor-domain-containing protein n=1 Tax=Microdochium trichocladiopsis TaxID=1682393 RepID=A0A9P8YJF8_9PEZI|nr:THO complex subunit 1 transcription elongation factor-domain-containing protein [Microdochium trichocladiopsis]KAH7041013.1 THO complex subunit 1 transcription elongation factor-domain-containing protein [Microdochium trichocladiopsis]